MKSKIVGMILVIVVIIFYGTILSYANHPCPPCDSCCPSCPEPPPCDSCCPPTPPCPECPDPPPCPDCPDCPNPQPTKCPSCPSCDGGDCCKIHIRFFVDGNLLAAHTWHDVPAIFDTLEFPDGSACDIDNVVWNVSDNASVNLYCGDPSLTAAVGVGGDCKTRIDFYTDNIYRKTVYWCDVPKQLEKLQFAGDNTLYNIQSIKWEVAPKPLVVIEAVTKSVTSAGILPTGSGGDDGMCFINTIQ